MEQITFSSTVRTDQVLDLDLSESNSEELINVSSPPSPEQLTLLARFDSQCGQRVWTTALVTASICLSMSGGILFFHHHGDIGMSGAIIMAGLMMTLSMVFYMHTHQENDIVSDLSPLGVIPAACFNMAIH